VRKNAAVTDRDKALVFSDAERETLTIRSQAGNIRAVRVVNMAGAEVAARRYDGGSPEEALRIAALPTGVYVVAVETGEGVYSAKFFK
jgi:hypothetical protein